MSIPLFLDSAQVAFNYLEITGLTDVETGGVGIITSFRAQAVTGLGWTEPSTALFKTPVDAAGRWLDVLLTRIDATHLEWRVRNAAGTTICTRRLLLTSGLPVRLYVNVYGCMIEALQVDPASSYTLQAHILDQSPDLQSDVANYAIGAGRLNNTNTDDGSGNIVGHYFAIDNGAAAHVAGRCPDARDTNSGARNWINAQSTILFRDVLISINQAGTVRWSGRICHMLLLDASVPPGTDRSIKIDTATTATFRATGQPVINTNSRTCMRKS